MTNIYNHTVNPLLSVLPMGRESLLKVRKDFGKIMERISYEFGSFRMDPHERVVRCGKKLLPLTPKVFDILLVLLQNPGRILTKEEIMKQVWPDTIVEESNLARNVSTLRKALGEEPDRPQFIETIPWRGYRFVAEVRKSREDAEAIDSLAVLPFINECQDPAAEYLSDGITESLIHKLSLLSNLKVMSRNSVFRYKVHNQKEAAEQRGHVPAGDGGGPRGVPAQPEVPRRGGEPRADRPLRADPFICRGLFRLYSLLICR